MKKLFYTFILLITSLTIYSQGLDGAAYPWKVSATFDSDAPCAVCPPFQYVQADSTLRVYVGGAWTTWLDPNNITGSNTDLSTSTTSVNVTINSSTGNNATIPAAQVSQAGVMSAADKTKLDGLGAPAVDNLSSGAFTVRVERLGTSATTLTTNATGDYELEVPSGTSIVSIKIFGNNTTLSGGSLIFRVDNSANSKDEWLISQMYNTTNGALVDVFTFGVNHTRTISSNIVTDTYPNMSGFGATGFDLIYR